MEQPDLTIQPDLSVCTYIKKPEKQLPKMLASVYQAADPVSVEVIVVDMSDGAAEIITKAFPEVIVYQNPSRENSAQAINRALELATGRYISLWQNDVIATPDCLTTLLTFMDDYPDIGIAGPKIVNAYGKPEPSCRKFHTPLSILACHTHLSCTAWGKAAIKKLTSKQPANNSEIDWLCSGVHLLRRELLEEIGFLDNSLGSPFAEMDYYARSKKMGWHNFYCPEAEVIHTRPAVYHHNLNTPPPLIWTAKAAFRYFFKRVFKKTQEPFESISPTRISQ